MAGRQRPVYQPGAAICARPRTAAAVQGLLGRRHHLPAALRRFHDYLACSPDHLRHRRQAWRAHHGPGIVQHVQPRRSAGRAETAPRIGRTLPAREVVAGATPPRQMSDLPKDELEHLAEEFGLDPTRFKTRQQLVSAIHDRRQMIAGMDREAMLDVIRWGRRPVTRNAQGADRPGNRPHPHHEVRRPLAARAGGAGPAARHRSARSRPVPLLVQEAQEAGGLFREAEPQTPLDDRVDRGQPDRREESAADYQFLPLRPPARPTTARR